MHTLEAFGSSWSPKLCFAIFWSILALCTAVVQVLWGRHRHCIPRCSAAVHSLSSPTAVLENCLYLTTVTTQVTGSIH